MYHKAYGIIETLAPLHVGASTGEETGNLNLIFRDQFTQTGIIPGSSIRGRFRADMRSQTNGTTLVNIWYGHSSEADEDDAVATIEKTATDTDGKQTNKQKKDLTTEALIKFEYASLLWLPVYCPGQPIVWVSCPRLLKRYQQMANITENLPKPVEEDPDDPNTSIQYPALLRKDQTHLFFNLGFLDNLVRNKDLSKWIPKTQNIKPNNLVVVQDDEMSLIHDMALYRQTRTQLNKNYKKVENFFGFEALPEESILVFPIAIKQEVPQKSENKLIDLNMNLTWKPFNKKDTKELYLGGLESIGCGRCQVTLDNLNVSGNN